MRKEHKSTRPLNQRGPCRRCGQDRMLVVNDTCLECTQEAADRRRWDDKLKDWNGLSEPQQADSTAG